MLDNDHSQALQAHVQEALAQQTPLNIIGGGSKAFYGQRSSATTPLKTEQHQGIINYEPSELVITVRSGTPLHVLETTLKENNQIIPFDPPDFNANTTIGGVIATGLSGSRRPYSGAARDAILGIKLINGKGEILEFGGRVMKNVAGYDVSRLMVGAMGTLGVLLEISFKLRPFLNDETTVFWPIDHKQALASLNQWFANPYNATATAYDGENLYLRTSGDNSLLTKQIGGSPQSLANADTFWTELKNHHHPWFQTQYPLWRISVKPSTPDLALEGKQLIEWGGGLRWLQTDLPAAKVREVVSQFGGQATLFRSPNPIESAFHPLPAGIAQLHRRLKQSFDPDGIFNPGRFYPDF